MFDVKLMPVISLWGFDSGKYGVPKSEDIEDALNIISNSGYTVTDDNTVIKSGDTQLMLGGIAKGYLGDVLMNVAREKNVTALVNLGGNIVLCGNKPDGSLWSVGIKNPLDSEELACSFESKGNRSVVTSGAYERYFEYGGKSYHHIIDPATGYPADSDLLSVTVIGEEGTVCDCLSTALFVAGKEEAIEFTKEFDSFQFVLITEDNEILYTDGIQNMELSSDDFTLKEIKR
jgi:thiamine biosynthesis lipoprotein